MPVERHRHRVAGRDVQRREPGQERVEGVRRAGERNHDVDGRAFGAQAARTRTGSPSCGPMVGIWRMRRRWSAGRSSRKSRRIRLAMTPDLLLAEAHSDARTRPAAERHIGALGDRLARAGREALGLEGVGVLPHVGQPVTGPRAVVDERLGGHGVPGKLEVVHGPPGPDPGRRVQPQRLVQAQLERRGVVRRAIGPLRRARQLVEEEGDRRRGGVVAGEQQRHDLVADVLVGELRPPSSSEASSSSERMSSPALSRSPAAIDFVVDQLVERGACALHAGERRARAPRMTCSQ